MLQFVSLIYPISRTKADNTSYIWQLSNHVCSNPQSCSLSRSRVFRRDPFVCDPLETKGINYFIVC